MAVRTLEDFFDPHEIESVTRAGMYIDEAGNVAQRSPAQQVPQGPVVTAVPTPEPEPLPGDDPFGGLNPFAPFGVRGFAADPEARPELPPSGVLPDWLSGLAGMFGVGKDQTGVTGDEPWAGDEAFQEIVERLTGGVPTGAVGTTREISPGISTTSFGFPGVTTTGGTQPRPSGMAFTEFTPQEIATISAQIQALNLEQMVGFDFANWARYQNMPTGEFDADGNPISKMVYTQQTQRLISLFNRQAQFLEERRIQNREDALDAARTETEKANAQFKLANERTRIQENARRRIDAQRQSDAQIAAQNRAAAASTLAREQAFEAQESAKERAAAVTTRAAEEAKARRTFEREQVERAKAEAEARRLFETGRIEFAEQEQTARRLFETEQMDFAEKEQEARRLFEQSQTGFEQTEQTARRQFEQRQLELQGDIAARGYDVEDSKTLASLFMSLQEQKGREEIARLQASTALQTGAMTNPFGFWASQSLGGMPGMGAPAAGAAGVPTEAGATTPATDPILAGLQQLGFRVPEGARPGQTVDPSAFFGGQTPTLGALSGLTPEMLQALTSILGFTGTSPGAFTQESAGITPGMGGRPIPSIFSRMFPGAGTGARG